MEIRSNSIKRLSYIEVYTNKSKLNKLNELEWVKEIFMQILINLTKMLL